MRLILPVDQRNKSNSEVATIQIVLENTDIPPPKAFAFDDSSNNEVGFEWMLMEKLPGTTLKMKWRTMSLGAKKNLVKQVKSVAERLLEFLVKAFPSNCLCISSPDFPNDFDVLEREPCVPFREDLNGEEHSC